MALKFQKKTSMPIFDYLLEEKVGFGRYHYISFIFIGFVPLSDGAEILSLSILIPVLKAVWDISDEEQDALGSILFVGILLGSILSGILSDRYGRRVALLYSSIIQFVIGITSALISDVTLFIIVRGLFGMLIGFTIPLAPALATELTPITFRGKSIVIINFFYTIGKLYSIMTAYFCLDSLEEGNWRMMLVLSSLPSLVVFLGSWLYLKESPRFLVAKGKVAEGADVLNFISAANDTHRIVNRKEKEALLEWHYHFHCNHAQGKSNPLRNLLSPKFKKITILLWIIWFCLNFVFYGMIFIIPFILQEIENKSNGKQSGITGLFYTILGEIPSTIVAYYLIEKQRFGRKNTLIFTNALAAFFFLVALDADLDYLVLLFTVQRFFVKLAWSIIYPFTNELYPTLFRTSGMGFASAFGRLGGVVMPVLLFWLFEKKALTPMIGFTIMSSLAACCTFLIPFDTRGRYVDLVEGLMTDETGDFEYIVKEEVIPKGKISSQPSLTEMKSLKPLKKKVTICLEDNKVVSA